MANQKQQYEDLKSFAAKHCIEIFRQYELAEIDSLRPSVIRAWECGRAISNLSDLMTVLNTDCST